MNRTAKIGQIMMTDVQIVHPDDTMNKVSDMFHRNDFHHIPVVEEDGTIAGIISKSDYFKLQSTITLFKRKDPEEYNKAIFRSLLVKDVMTKQVVMLHPEDSLEMAAGIF